METIKVTYNSIVRRFNITNSTTWAELESKLRSLYKIPTTSSLTVSYTDEDDDVITVSSDLELKEILSQQSSGRPIRLVLNTVNNINDSENWVLENGNNENEHDVENKLSSEKVNGNHLNPIEDISSQPEQQQTTEREEENLQSRPPPYYRHVSFVEDDDDEANDDQSTPLLHEEKEKEEGSKQQQQQQPEKTKETSDSDDDDDDDDGIIFIISRPTFFGPRFGLFGGPRFGLFDRPYFNPGPFGHCSFRGSSYNPYVYGRPQCYGSASFNGPSTCHFSSRQYNPNSCGQKSNNCGRNSKKQQSGSYDKNSEASTSASAQNRCNKNDYSSRPSCNRNFNLFNPCHGNQTPLTQGQLDDKLSTLHSMGFNSSNDALYEELLKRYNGNLERVIELLLRNQQVNEHYDNEKVSNKQKGIVINEKKAQNNYDSEKNVDDNEKSKPYVL